MKGENAIKQPQDKIWEYFQNEGGFFRGARPRHLYILQYLESGQQVLNIGLGEGFLEKEAMHRGIDIHILDPDEHSIIRMRECLHIGEKAQIGYAQAIPFDDCEFDAVIMSEVLEHLDDLVLSKSLREVHRVLRHNGRLIITVPYKEDLNSNMVACPKCGEVFHKVGHARSFDKNELISILEENHFKISKIYVRSFPDWSRPGIRNLLKSMARYILGRLGERVADPHIFAIAASASMEQGSKAVKGEHNH